MWRVKGLCLRRSDLVLTKSSFVSPAGVDGNNAVVPESNGDGVLGPESGEMWPIEMEPVAGNPAPLNLEEKAGVGAGDGGEDAIMAEERLAEDCLDEQTQEEKHNCEGLSPQNQLEEPDAEPTELETIFIAPLDGCQAELRSRVIKEVRKPGRSECQRSASRCVTLSCGELLNSVSFISALSSDYQAIMSLLEQVKGPLNVQRYFIQHAIREAVR